MKSLITPVLTLALTALTYLRYKRKIKSYSVGVSDDSMEMALTAFNSGSGNNVQEIIDDQAIIYDPKLGKNMPAPKVPRIAAVLAIKAKLELANPKYTEANLIIVHKYLNKEMETQCVRFADRNRVLAIAKALVFIETQDEIVARKALLNPLISKQKQDTDAQFWNISVRRWFNGGNFIEQTSSPKA